MNSLIHGFDNGKNAGKIFIIVRLIEKLIHLEYVDTGKGIELEALEKIFELFLPPITLVAVDWGYIFAIIPLQRNYTVQSLVKVPIVKALSST